MKPVIRINGERTNSADIEAIEVEPGVYSVLVGSVSWEARVYGSEIVIGGESYHFAIEDPRRWQRSSHAASAQGQVAIKAAMPGKVVRVLVAAGDTVTAGQGIIVVEAMKMQNELKAPRDGQVVSLEVKQDDSVIAGATLVIIE